MRELYILLIIKCLRMKNHRFFKKKCLALRQIFRCKNGQKKFHGKRGRIQ